MLTFARCLAGGGDAVANWLLLNRRLNRILVRLHLYPEKQPKGEMPWRGPGAALVEQKGEKTLDADRAMLRVCADGNHSYAVQRTSSTVSISAYAMR